MNINKYLKPPPSHFELSCCLFVGRFCQSTRTSTIHPRSKVTPTKYPSTGLGGRKDILSWVDQWTSMIWEWSTAYVWKKYPNLILAVFCEHLKTNQEDLRTSLDIAHLISGIKPPKKETKVSKPRKRKSFLSIGTRSGSLAERHGNYGPSTAWATKLGFHSGWWHTRGRIIWFYSGHWLWCVYIYTVYICIVHFLGCPPSHS